MPPPDQGIRQGTQDSFRLSVVNVRICPVQVAQRLHQPVTPLLEHKPVVRSIPARGHRKTQLERHVEPRRRRRVAVKADTREIVE